MESADIVAFVRERIEPTFDTLGERTYRCAAYLTDGLYLPCVLVASATARVNLALRRFEETQRDAARPRTERRFGRGFEYRDIVQTFAAEGDRVNTYHIARLEESPFALPVERLGEIRGETSMGWTQFVGIMHDGREFSFGTTFTTEFFQMPEGYVATDVAHILPHERRDGPLYRERPFFDCYVEAL